MGELEAHNHDGLEGYRKKFPVVKNITGDPAMIPFTSDIKFNMMVRDLNPSVSNPSTAKDNMAVFLKGAPERVLSRCTKILNKGEEVDFTDNMRADVNTANNKFGGMGERVLAFARYELEPERYTKGSYPFDTKDWK